jgi:hypothetical protein
VRTIQEIVVQGFPEGGLAGVGLRLEITGLAGASGVPIWKYERALATDLDGARDLRMLLRGRSSSWRPVEPRGRPAAARVDSEDAIKARVRELAQKIASEAVGYLAAPPVRTSP